MTISPSSKGWVNKYFSLIENYEDVLNRFPGSILNAEELIYSFLQPTGFLYGMQKLSGHLKLSKRLKMILSIF